jgi:hypothetical protein
MYPRNELAWAALAGLAFTAAGAAAAAAPSADPWASVPPKPETFYEGVDTYSEKLRAVSDTVREARTRQETINSELTDRIKSIEPMQLAAKMQEFMMQNPQEAAKLMQEQQSAGTEGTEAEVATNDKFNALKAEEETLLTRYKAALAQAVAPIDAKFKDLDARAQKDMVAVGESWTYAPWAVKEYNALALQRNAAVERVCKDWWSPSGQLPAWLDRLRDLLKAQVVTRERMANASVGIQVHLIETPAAPYKPTAAHDAVIQYLQEAKELYAKRERWPTKPYSS